METPRPSARGFLGYALIGFLVGVLPIALGLLWLPSLRRADAHWLAAFMALTAGLLTFLGVEALFEAFDLQAAAARARFGARAGPARGGLSFLTDVRLPRPAKRRRTASSPALRGLALATCRRRHRPPQPRRGPRDRHVVRLGELTLGTFLIVGFMVHNLTEGLGIAAPLAEGRADRAGASPRLSRSSPAPLRSSAPGSAATQERPARRVLLRAAAGAAAQVVVEVTRFVARRAPGGLRSGHAIGGFLAGLVVMYATGLLVA